MQILQKDLIKLLPYEKSKLTTLLCRTEFKQIKFKRYKKQRLYVGITTEHIELLKKL